MKLNHILIGILTALLLASSASASWWNSDYAYKLPVEINNTAGQVLTAYQVNVSIPSGINATSIRVVNETAGDTVYHWCENVTGGDCYELWFNATHIPAGAWCNDTYAIYYGNDAVASTSDYDNTFTKSHNTTGLVLELHMDEGTGFSQTNDSSGEGNHGTLTNMNVTGNATSGWQGTDGGYWGDRSDMVFSAGDQLRFDGANDYVDCGTNAILNPTDEMTVSIWIYPLFNIGDVSATYADRIGFYTNTRNVWYTFRDGKQYIMYLNDADDYDFMYGTKSTWDINKWYNLIFTYSILNNEANLYVNGIIDNTCADNGALKAGGVTSIIGYYNKHFNGYIDEVRVYNRSLSEEEIYRQYIRSKYAADAPTTTIGEEEKYLKITLHSVSPATIPTNYTGAVSVSYIVESTNPLNLSSLAFLYGINYTITGDMHAYVVAPSNTIAADGIYRAPNRNTTPYLSWEDNATITEGNVWQWAGGDNGSGWITKTPINATHTWINITSDQDPIFASSFYLDQLSMYSAPKTGIEINKAQGVIIKTYDLEQFRNRNNDYWINLYFDTDVEATPDSNIGIWYCNDSFDPTTDDPIDFCDYKASWTSDRWMNHSWTPHQNASYARPLTLSADIPACSCPPTDYNYIYLTSETVSSKSYILNATNSDPGICNLTFAQTETMWTRDETAGVNSPIAYTPSFFQTFVRDDEEYLHHLYIADVNGTWAHSGINNITIGVSHYPVAAPSFEYFNITCTTFGYTHDSMMDSTYDGGHFHIGVYCHADPDGGTVSHNLTLHYANGTLAGIINDTLTTTTPGIVEINFATTPYYSTTEGYTLKCVSTDDEGESGTAWLGTFFTLAADGTQGYYTDGYLMFWGMNDIPTLYATIANDSLISYHSGDDIYTMHVPFFKSKCNDTFRFNETVRLESLNTEDVAYFKFTGETIFDGATIMAWDTSADAAAPTTDAYRGYLLSHGRVTGNITNSDLSNLGSDVYRQEGVNFVDNTMDYLIYNTTFSHNSRGLIMEECENFNISHCTISDNVETGIGVYYSDSITVENCFVSGSAYDPGLYLYEASNNTIRYNIITDCADYGMRIRSNSNNNLLIGNDITGSVGYDYYFSSSSINNTIRDPESSTDEIRCTATSEVNIENTDNTAFTEDSSNSTHAYPTNFSMSVTGVTHTFNITQIDMTLTPDTGSIQIWNIVWGNVVTFNASNVSGSPSVWFNATVPAWSNSNIAIYRNDSIYANESADASGAITYNYSGGWSEHWFEFNPENVAPDMPSVVTPADGATGTSTNPTLRVQVTDDNSADMLNVTFYTSTGAQIGSTQTGITNGSTASVVWSGRSYSTTYYWYAIADDGTAQTQSDTWDFRTQGSGGGSSHVIAITGCTDWSGNAGTQVYIDFGCTGETGGATFTTDSPNGAIDSSTGVYTWSPGTGDGGVYNWRFNVENVYSVSDYCDVTITVYHYASPTNLAATTGNFWVNHTWGGNGYADSYNVSVNDAWVNNSANQYTYHVSYPHGWSNISVAAYNDITGLSSFISNDVQVPNNPIVLTNYSVLMLATAGENVSVDMNHEDLDGDVATYYCSRMDLFADFNTADGTGQYTSAVNGTHEVIFGVTDGYGWDNETITIEVGTVHPLELDEETPLLLFAVLVILLFGSLFYIYHAASYVAKIVTALISTWMSFMLSTMAVSGNVVINYAELSAGDVFIYGAHSIQIAALSHFFMFTGSVSALFMLVFAVKLVMDTYRDMQDDKKAEDEWDGVE